MDSLWRTHRGGGGKEKKKKKREIHSRGQQRKKNMSKVNLGTQSWAGEGRGRQGEKGSERRGGALLNGGRKKPDE